MDSGRAWLVVAACCCINAFALAVIRSGAIVYVGVANTFRVTREDAAWPLCLATLFNLAAGPVSGVLARYFNICRLMRLGCLLASLSVSVSFFATGVPYLSVSLGVLHGCGLSLVALSYAVVNQNVSQYRALASGISNGGFVLGGILFPPLVQYLFDVYGTRGGLLVFGAVMLNSTAAALLTSSPCSNTPRSKTTTDCTEPRLPEVGAALLRSDSGEHPSLRMNPCCVSKTDQTISLRDARCAMARANKETLNLSSESISNNRRCSLRQDAMVMCLSFVKLPKFYIVAYTMGQLWFLSTTLLTVVVDYAADRDMPKWEAVSLVTLITAPDLVARFTSGLATDKGVMRKSTMMAACCVGSACSYAMMPSFATYSALAAIMVVAGWCNGAAVAHIFVLAADIADPETFSMCLGIMNFIGAFALLERPLVIGYCRDNLGSYDGVFYFMTAVALSCAGLWAAVHYQEDWRKRQLS
ncbi:monocarboxylate transporter 12 isoform X1 [Rhipicephalus microplus]|uniref:monocarboxylate transporter 12 isoform X1 n=1 Tax=Rhipicephalus microplus TaxID=6941 RepID=UPI003F6BBBC7